MGRQVVYSQQVIDETIALYESGESIAEINKAMGLKSATTIYHFLKRRGITTRKAQVEMTDLIKRKDGAIDLVLTTDKEGWVIGAENKAARKNPLFVVEFSGFLEIEANSIEEALVIARKREIVKRIHSVREKTHG